MASGKGDAVAVRLCIPAKPEYISLGRLALTGLWRLRTVLLTVFAAVAVILAISGVYGVMAYTVLQRTQEIGVRVALGASQGDVVRMVVLQGARLAFVGVAIGLAGAALAARALEGMLFEMQRLDPITYAGAAIVLSAAALLASYLPARRAASVSPVVSLAR